MAASSNTEVLESNKPTEELASAVIRFAGDSGDGMQLAGTQFTDTSAIFGNDVATLPDFPAEIRAPAGTVAGVSGFQINFAASDITYNETAIFSSVIPARPLTHAIISSSLHNLGSLSNGHSFDFSLQST